MRNLGGYLATVAALVGCIADGATPAGRDGGSTEVGTDGGGVDAEVLVGLEFAAPRDGDEFDSSDDIDPNLDGTQIALRIQTSGLHSSEQVELLHNDQRVEVLEAAPVLSAVVTLRAGANALELALAGSERNFSRIVVSHTELCGQATFVSPVAPSDGSDLLLGGDNPACGIDGIDGIDGTDGIDVVVAVQGQEDGTGLTLMLNGATVDSVPLDRGLARFSAVPLARSSNDLSVRIESGGGGTCPVIEFPVPIVVQCSGPSCRISAPAVGATLTSSDDMDALVPGLQIDVAVETDTSALGRDIRLYLDGQSDNALFAGARMGGDGVVATFPSVSLADGLSRRVTAECSDALGNVTRTTQTWDVDSANP